MDAGGRGHGDTFLVQAHEIEVSAWREGRWVGGEWCPDLSGMMGRNSLVGMMVILLGHAMPQESKRTCPSDLLMPPTYPLALRCLLPAHILGGLFLMGADGRLQICLDSPSFYTAVEANLAVTLSSWAAHLLCPPNPTSGTLFGVTTLVMNSMPRATLFVII